MEREIPQELRRYVEEEILPQYAQSDPAHGLGHIQAVVENSLELLDLVPADPGWCTSSPPTTTWGRPGSAGRTTRRPPPGSCGRTGLWSGGSPRRSGN